MAETCKTVKIVSTHAESQGDYVEINAEDFVEGVHELYDGPSVEEVEAVPVTDAAKAQAEAAAAAKAKLEGNGGWGANPA